MESRAVVPAVDGGLTQRDGWVAAGLALVALAAYAPALRLGFLSDDFLILSTLQRLGGLRNWVAFFDESFYDYYRPLVFLSHALDWRFWGLTAAGFHFTNVALHALNTALVFLLVRRLATRPSAAAAAVVFALHPANQESVFWIAGRFDLLSTAWVLLALLALWMTRRWSMGLAAAAFGLALLSKESALTFLVVSVARDVVLGGRGWRRTVARLAPFLAVTFAYILLRGHAQLPAVGGLHRSGKALMLVSAIVGLVIAAGRRTPSAAGTSGRHRRLRTTLVWMAVSLAMLATAMLVPAIRQRLGPTVGFVTYAAYLIGPSGLFSEPFFLDPNRFAYVVAGMVGVTAAVGLTVQFGGWWLARPRWLFAAIFIAGALVPVSAMPGRTHLYLSTIGVSLLTALVLDAVPRSKRVFIAASIIGACGVNLVLATTEWQRASVMTREAIALVAPDARSCAREVLFLTSPAGIHAVPCNLNYEAFAIERGCHVQNLQTLLRVVREDAVVMVTRPAPGEIELRLPDYRGNAVASTDLSHFVVQVRAGESASLETPVGLLRTWPDHRDQVFRLRLSEAGSRADLLYYSDGHVSAVSPR